MRKRTVITQKQIAEKAGVSQTVVSLALNQSYSVNLSEDTRQRVLDVAAELGYVPQAAAKSLVEGRSNNIGLILVRPHYQVFRDPYIPNVITGLAEVVREHGYRLLVEHITDIDQLDIIGQMMKGGEVAGIVLSGDSRAESIAAPLMDEGYPIVMLDESSELPCSVVIDHLDGVTQAAEHIIGLGHQRVAMIHYSPYNSMSNNRVQNVFNIFEQHNQPIDPKYLRYGQYDPESGYQAMQSILSTQPMPTAVIGMNDMMAVGAMRALLDNGIRIPEDVAVIGYDDMRFAAFTNPALTTVRAPEIEQGRIAGQRLLNLMMQRETPQHIKLKPKLVIRASCGAM